MKFVFASDSFKGTLSSAEIGAMLCESARAAFPDCDCRSVTISPSFTTGRTGELSAIRMPGPRTTSISMTELSESTRWLTSSVELLNASPMPTRNMLCVMLL